MVTTAFYFEQPIYDFLDKYQAHFLISIKSHPVVSDELYPEKYNGT
jgi:hypothetical protein